MRSIRRVGALAVAGLLVSAIGSGPAGADTPASYTGSASGFALKLTLANQGITAGTSTVKATTDGTGGTSEATGAGAIVGTQTSPVATAKNPPGETKPEVCADSAANAIETAAQNILQIGLGCGTASATGTGLTTVSSANGKVGALDLNLQTVLSALPVTAPVTATLSGVLKQICDGLPAQLKPAGCAVTGELTATIQSLGSTKTLSAEFGSSTSGVSVSGSTVTSESTASGAVVRLLPNATLNGVPIGEPLVTVSIARANAKVLCSLDTGVATPSFDPAIVRVKFSNPLAAILPNQPDLLPKIALPGTPLSGATTIDPTLALQSGELTLTPGSTLVLFPGLPIQTEIVVGNGSTKANPDGSASATADGVKVHALQLIGTVAAPLAGGLLANLAHAEAAGACVAATVSAPPPPPDPEIIRELPRTGGPVTPWLPMAGAAGLVLAAITRRAARAR